MSVFLATALVAGCAPSPRVYTSNEFKLHGEIRVAVLPFDNLTDAEGAARHVHDIFTVELLKTGKFSVVDPGEVEGVLTSERIRFISELSSEQTRKIASDLNVSALIEGTVLEYGIRQVQGYNVTEVPFISLLVKMVDAGSGKILWASSYSRNGNDTEKVFGIGRITSLDRLTEVMAREVVKSLRRESLHRMEEMR